jgi:nucleoside-diphosphate kinase
MLAEEHYAEHRGKIFYPSLIEYITGCIHYPQEPWKRRVIALVYQGPNAIEKIRDISGPTNPHIARETRPGCIRALGTVVPLKDSEGNVIGDLADLREALCDYSPFEIIRRFHSSQMNFSAT